jgi:hypothetical protein
MQANANDPTNPTTHHLDRTTVLTIATSCHGDTTCARPQSRLLFVLPSIQEGSLDSTNLNYHIDSRRSHRVTETQDAPGHDKLRLLFVISYSRASLYRAYFDLFLKGTTHPISSNETTEMKWAIPAFNSEHTWSYRTASNKKNRNKIGGHQLSSFAFDCWWYFDTFNYFKALYLNLEHFHFEF